MKKQEALDLIQATIGRLDPSMRTANGGHFEIHRNDDIEVGVGGTKKTEKIEDWRVHWIDEDGSLKYIYDELSSSWRDPKMNAQYVAQKEVLIVEDD